MMNEKILKRKQKLNLTTNALRLINGKGDGFDGLIVEQYKNHFLAQVFDAAWLAQMPDLMAMIKQEYDVEYFVVKDRTHSAQADTVDHQVLVGHDSRTVVEENGIKFNVDLNDGLNTGLFLDMRANRLMVGQRCRGKKVLNCFAYSCSFGVYARTFGAAEVVNVDISKKILEKGRANYELNGLLASEQEFIRGHAPQFLSRAVKKNNRFDVIVIDPPSFARHELGDFQVKKDLPNLVRDAFDVINPGGAIFVATNFNGLTHAHLEEIFLYASRGKKFQSLTHHGQDKDFTKTNTFKESYLVATLGTFPANPMGTNKLC